jgi:GWxTD domain-containing protein
VKIFKLFAVGAALCAAPAALAGQAAPALAVRAVRFWLPEYRQTVVKAFVQIPYMVLTPTDVGPNGALSYRITVRVADSTGLTLMQQSWSKRAEAGLRTPGASGFEILEFAVNPGKFRLELAIEDSVSGTRIERSLDLQGFGDAPGASDLVVAPRMRVSGTADSIPKPGELRRGNTVLTAAAEVMLGPLEDRAKLYYYLEAYSQGADSGTLALEVQDESGKTMVSIPTRRVQFAAGGGVLRGQLDLTGLPEGKYRLRAGLAVGGRTTERTAPFQMGSLATALTQDEERRTELLVSDSGYFGAMGNEELDEAFAPLSYISTAEDRLQVWSPQLSLQGKRNFLVAFWGRRDNSVGTPKNEAREAFYGKIAQANERFTDRQRGSRSGWRTDMGRVFIRNGEPTETLKRQQVGVSAPYQVWRYAQARDKWFIFIDRTSFGSFELTATNDAKEPSRPGWEGLVGPDALADIGSFLGIDFLRRSRQVE